MLLLRLIWKETGCVMCLILTMLYNIGLCRYFRDNAGVIVGIFLVCCIHCVSNGVGRRGNLSVCLCDKFHYFL